MSHIPRRKVDANSLIGNPADTREVPVDVVVDASVALGAALTALPPQGRTVTGSTTALVSDFLGRVTSTSATPVDVILPNGFDPGFWFISLQGGAGQVSYVAGSGATILNNAVPKSGGLDIDNFYARCEVVDNGQWLVTGRLA